MSHALLIAFHFHEGRYHGQPEWPPAPARVFQALLAGSARGRVLPPEHREALAWLQKLPPPIIAAPAARRGQGYRNYVPNNDLDAVGNDPRRISEIRTAKLIRPRLFGQSTPFLYVWRFEHGTENAVRIAEMAERVYQLGRGVDTAWASADIASEEEVEPRLIKNGGVQYWPSDRGDRNILACPESGSLASLEDRFVKAGVRFGDANSPVFSQAPKPCFRPVAYDSPSRRLLFELRKATEEAPFVSWPLAKASSLVESIRDEAAKNLTNAQPEKASIIDRVVIGRNAKTAAKAERIRIIPLPSIGSPHVVRSIRRVLIEIPPNCPVEEEAIGQAFSGLDVIDLDTGVVIGNLVRTSDEAMLVNYGVGSKDGEGYRVWRTVTPAALPERTARRRIDPARLAAELTAARISGTPNFKEAKSSRERSDEESYATAAVVDTLRHADISAKVENIQVQREPFEGRGARAEDFAGGTRFAKERLWHAEIILKDAVQGPLVIGDGRYLGLGLMMPMRDARRDLVSFALPKHINIATKDRSALVHVVRRSLMAISRDINGQVTQLFSGHEDDGGPAASGSHKHVFLAADDSDRDGRIDRIIVAAPWMCDHSVQAQWWTRKAFDEVTARLTTIRAGRLGVIALGPPVSFDFNDPLVGPACTWESRMPYLATRHTGRNKDAVAALILDVVTECSRRRLPKPEVKVLEFQALPGGAGLRAQIRLHFDVAVQGPLLLGRDSHGGGGMFAVRL